MKKSGFVTLKVFVYISNLLLRRYYHLASLLPQGRNPDASRLFGPHDPRGVVRHRSWVATTPTRGGGRTSRTGSDPRARETVTSATRAENAQPWAVEQELQPGAGTATARGLRDS